MSPSYRPEGRSGDHDHWFYFDVMSAWKPSVERDTKPKAGSAEQNLDLAEKIDRTARVLIEYLLEDATKIADQPLTRKLLKSGVGDEDAPDVKSVRRLLEAKDIGAAADSAAHEALEKRLNSRIGYLKGFILAAARVRREYKDRLRRLRKKSPGPKRVRKAISTPRIKRGT